MTPPAPPVSSAPLLLTDPAEATPATWGGKGAALARLRAAGLPAPPAVALAPAAFVASLDAAQAAAVEAGTPTDADLESLRPSGGVEEAVAEALAHLHHPAHVAVRSSAPDEDGAEHAFAGQLASFLFVPPEDVAARVADVWRSAFAPRVAAYRAARGIAGPPRPPAVVLQPMIDADAAGVAFSADPVTGDRSVCVVAAVRGLGSALVDGRADAETIRVGPGGAVRSRETPRQGVADRPAPGGRGGVREELVTETGRVLSDRQAAEVAALARRAADLFGAPQDVEWAVADGRLWILQSRPITGGVAPAGGVVEESGNVEQQSPPPSGGRPGTARSAQPGGCSGPGGAVGSSNTAWPPPQPSPGGGGGLERSRTAPPEKSRPAPDALRLWDNANIVESYPGVTTPLTFSFAQRAYSAVYRTFCRVLGVPEARVEAEAATFDQMIGLVRGRIYYNLGSWYRVLALLPGYRLNAPLMESMMGVKEGVPDGLRPTPPSGGRLADAWALARSVAGLVSAHRRLDRMKADFLARVDDALESGGAAVRNPASPPSLHPEGAERPSPIPPDDLPALAAAWDDLERRLLRQWDAPLVNDFFCMVWFGLASRAADAWIGPGALGGLLAGDGNVVSAEPARRVRDMAAQVDPGWAETLATAPPAEIEAGLAERPAFASAIAGYVDRFGDRCLEELKLESPTLADDATPLYRAVGATALRGGAADDADVARLRADAEARAAEALRGHPARRLVFGRLLRLARARVRDRENLRFERTRVFGRARRLALAIGRGLAGAGRLGDPRDVFYLTVDELLDAARGRGGDLLGTVSARRAESDGWRDGPAPPDRFTTTGDPTVSPLVPTAPAAEAEGGEVRTGLGCCAGVVEGTVRVVRDPRGVDLAPGTILVAERTDPGWILLFPACAGLVVERGSLLSHSAIVARELGIPAAVAVAGATAWLADGDRVRLDGATGRVERIGRGGAGDHA